MPKRESMFYLLFIFVVNSLQAVYDEGQTSITIDWNTINLRSLNNTFSVAEVLENQTLSILFNNVPAQKIACIVGNDKFGSRLTSKLHRSLMMPVIEIPKSVADMVTFWMCSLDPGTTHDAYFEIKVKSAKHLEVKINGTELFFKTANLTMPYDGSAVYRFRENERINLVCSANNIFWTLDLHYYDNSGVKINQTRANGFDKTFKMLMTADKENSYIDCTLSSTSFKPTFTNRIIFKRRNDPLPPTTYDLIVSLNNEELMPEVTSTGEININYQYIFHSIDVVLVKCQKRYQERYGAVKFENEITIRGETGKLNTYKNNAVRKVLLTPSEISVRILLNDRYLRKAHAHCYIKNSPYPISAKISFISRTEVEKEQTSTARYVGDDEDYNDEKPILKDNIQFPNQTAKSPSAANTNNKQTSTARYVGDDEDNNDEKPILKDNIYFPNQTAKSPSAANTNNNSTSNLIVGCVAGVIAAALTAGCVVFWCKRNKNPTPPKNSCDNSVLPVDDTILETLRQQLDSPPTYDYAYMPPSAECSYRHGTYTCRQRRPSTDSGDAESHYYCEIDEYFITKRDAARKNRN